MKNTKRLNRKRIHYRIRKKLKGTASRPRISIFRSNREIYAQAIDDLSGRTLCSASSREESIDKNAAKVDQALQVGKIFGERVKELNVESVVFDRAGYLYHGRVKALAEGTREAGIKF